MSPERRFFSHMMVDTILVGRGIQERAFPKLSKFTLRREFDLKITFCFFLQLLILFLSNYEELLKKYYLSGI